MLTCEVSERSYLYWQVMEFVHVGFVFFQQSEQVALLDPSIGALESSVMRLFDNMIDQGF